MELEKLLKQLPYIIRTDLEGQEPGFAEACALDYLAADDITKADILAFFVGNSPDKIQKSKLRYEENIPLPTEIESWMDYE